MSGDPGGFRGGGRDSPEAIQRRIDAHSHLADASALPPARRVYVNRTLRFDHIELVGFDMDYTLAHYSKRQLEELSYDLTAQRLVDRYGYPEAILDIRYRPEFAIRGLVVDKKEGNLFKMDRHHHVGRVYHGHRALTKEERRALYRNVKIRLKSRKYHWIDTLFAVPEAVLYADLVDFKEAERGPRTRRIDYWQLFEDIRSAIDEIHRDGTLKSVVKKDVAKYVEIDPDLPKMLHRLRSSGKRLFVLTNSMWPYTETLMEHILDGQMSEYPSWRKYFDFVIVGSKKPSFFTEDRPFYEVDPETGVVSKSAATRFERQRIYQGGSLKQFESILGQAGEEILYVGDHIYGDIIRSKKDTLWRTALIVPELEDELKHRRPILWAEQDLIELEERRASLEQEITQAKLQISALEQAIDDDPELDEEREQLTKLRRDLRLRHDRDRRDLKNLIERRDEYADTVDTAYNEYWGSMFKEGGESSAFARQIEFYACLYTSRVSNLFFYSPAQYFRAPRHWLPHEKL